MARRSSDSTPPTPPMAASSNSAFQGDPVAVYAFVGQFFESLRSSGVEHVCISPGSRSTPLAIAADRTSGLRTWIGLDERASSFFALGLAKATGRAVALVCTSGTAAANYLPAIVEASYSRVPLLVLTADRPPELRDWGAGQTIEQPGLYGRYPRWAAEVPIPTPGEDALRYASRLAARAVDEAQGEQAGAVHLNWPFREPLAPPVVSAAAADAASDSWLATPRFSHAEKVADERDVEELARHVRENERGVICCGPMDASPTLVAALVKFAAAAGWPVLAGPASRLRGVEGDRAGTVLSMSDGFLRAPDFAANHSPTFVLRVGETPVSKAQRLWIEASAPRHVWWLDADSSWGEPSHRVTRVVRGGAVSLLEGAAALLEGAAALPEGAAALPEDATSLVGGPEAREQGWLRSFASAEEISRRMLDAFVAEPGNFSGLTATARVSSGLGPGDVLFASNSMSIRLLDLAHRGSNGPLRVLCSRGASGIDGINSTALGIAAAGVGRTVLLTGDLALLHDLSGLLTAKQASIDLVIVVLDDDGGGIFSFLPVADQAEAVGFERLFGTPHGLDLSRVAELFELDYARATHVEELDRALAAGLARGGVHLIHVPLDRAANERLFRGFLATLAAQIDAGIPA